jgi:tetraacyldisaccharide 4'-kinase
MSVVDIVNGKPPEGVEEMLITAFLSAARPVYYSLLCLHRGLYSRGLKKVRRLPCRVVCIGNLTLGGSGKTPVTLMSARLVREAGRRLVILSRGYKRIQKKGDVVIVSDGVKVLATPAEAGDEPFLLARSLPGVPVVVSADRFAGGCAAMERFTPDAILLDDGFQHWGLARDCDIVCLDATRPLKNLRLFPRGTLRELPSALRRAQAVIFTRTESATDLNEQERFVRAVNPHIPLFRLRYALDACLPLSSEETHPLSPEELNGKKVFLFCGIARPETFFKLATQVAPRIEGKLAMPDHIRYDKERIRELRQAFSRTDAEVLLTTEKDAVKLITAGVPRMPVHYFRLKTVLEGEHAAQEFIQILLEAKKA